jgi:hypothetical protein
MDGRTVLVLLVVIAMPIMGVIVGRSAVRQLKIEKKPLLWRINGIPFNIDTHVYAGLKLIWGVFMIIGAIAIVIAILTGVQPLY